jgi:DNA-binding FadR family transcriptional regulator
LLEPQCAKLLAEDRTNSDIERLRECLQAGANEVDSNEAEPLSSHLAFHQLIVELSGNETLMLMSSMLRHILHDDDRGSRADVDGSGDRRRIRRAQKEHQKLVDLIEKRDGQRAEQFWTRHLTKGDDEVKPAWHDASLSG